MPRYLLSDSVRNTIEARVDQLFDRLLGRIVGPRQKTMVFEVVQDKALSIPGIFASATAEGGGEAINANLLTSLVRITSNYINGIRERTKAKVIHEVESAISSSEYHKMPDIMKELEGHLSNLWISTTAEIKRIVQTEVSNASNEGLHDAISKVNLSFGVTDPVVMKIVVHDDVLCETCRELWLMPDGVTPRLYYMSELKHGYMTDHKHPEPSVGVTHPMCRCTMSTLLTSYGFNEKGEVTFIGFGHSEIKKQRGQNNE